MCVAKWGIAAGLCVFVDVWDKGIVDVHLEGSVCDSFVWLFFAAGGGV